MGQWERASQYYGRAPSGCGPEAFGERHLVRPRADEGPRRTDPGDQVRLPPHVGRAEPAGGETGVPVRNTGRDLRRARQGRRDAPRRRAAPDRRPTCCALHLQRQRAPGPAQGRRATSWPSIWRRTASRRIASPLASSTKIATCVPDGYTSFSSSWLSSADMRRESDLISWICSSRPLICSWSDEMSFSEGFWTAA